MTRRPRQPPRELPDWPMVAGQLDLFDTEPRCLVCGVQLADDDPARGYCVPCNDLHWAETLTRRAARDGRETGR